MDNGHEITTLKDVLEQTATAEEIKLPPRALARLQKLQLKAAGAAIAAQAAVDAANAEQAKLQAALTAVCEDAGMAIPAQANVPVDLDWDTGVLRFRNG